MLVRNWAELWELWANGTEQGWLVAQVRLAAQVRLVRGLGSLQRRTGLQQVQCAGSFHLARLLEHADATISLRLARERHARRSYYCGDNAQFFVLHAALGESVRVAIVRTGVALSSLACWLAILIGAGSSEVGARSPGADVGIAFVCMS